MDRWESQLSIVVRGAARERRDRRRAARVDDRARRGRRAGARVESTALMATSPRVEKPPDRGVPIRGPSAVAGDFRRSAVADARAREERLQAALLRLGARLPVAAHAPAACCSACCTSCSRRSCGSPTTPNFGVALLLGIVLYTFFAEATGGAVACVMVRENLVRKIHFPRIVIPMAVVMVACFNLVLNLVVVVDLRGGLRACSPRWRGSGCLPLLVAARLRRGPGDAAVGAVRALPRHRADLGRRAAGHVLRLADPRPRTRPSRRARRSAARCSPTRSPRSSRRAATSSSSPPTSARADALGGTRRG